MSSVKKRPGTGTDRDRDSLAAKRSMGGRRPPGRPSRPGSAGKPSGRPGSSGNAADDAKARAAKRIAKRRPAASRPSARAAARKAANASRPMPAPPARRTAAGRRPIAPAAAAAAGTTPTAMDELRLEVDRIQDQFADLESKAQLSTVYSAIGDFDSKLVELPFAIDALRDRGYVHSGRLDDRLEALDQSWDNVRPRVEAALNNHIRRLDQELNETERQVDTLRPNSAAISAAKSAVNSLSGRIDAARDAVSGLYEGMELELSGISSEISAITRMMDLLAESQAIRLLQAEGPLLAVKTEWQRDGKDGPEGVLFLTDQRLLFEQREEVVTKKTFGIFKSASETKIDLLLDIQVGDVESVTDKQEGGFLGMGKDDILEFVFAASAPVSRARFHLKGHDSSDWAAMIKRIQTDEIDEDRADEYVDELQEAVAVAAAFPSACPSCFAELPPPPVGIMSVSCEFCGAQIEPEGAGNSE